MINETANSLFEQDFQDLRIDRIKQPFFEFKILELLNF